MIEGKCPKCHQLYFGWALLQPRNQSCAKCGTALLITMDGGKPVAGYSPFTAEIYRLKAPDKNANESKSTNDKAAI